jgi:splicing factor 3B subunit 4
MSTDPRVSRVNSLYVGELDQQVTADILFELFLQAGPVSSVNIPYDRLTASHPGFGFVEMASEEDALYAMQLLNGVPLFGTPIRVSRSVSTDATGFRVFVGNLDPAVDDAALVATFGSVAHVVGTHIGSASGTASKGFAFVTFDSAEGAAAAVATLNGQMMHGRPLRVEIAQSSADR